MAKAPKSVGGCTVADGKEVPMETREQMGGAYEGIHAVLDALVVLQRAAHGLTGGSTWSDRRARETTRRSSRAL